jgi:hypothetical protein
VANSPREGRPSPTATPRPAGNGHEAPPQRERVISCLLDAGIEFWQDTEGSAFVSIAMDGHIERHGVRTRGFRRLVRRLYGLAHTFGDARGRCRPSTLGRAVLDDAVEALDAMAESAPVREPGVRVVRHEGATWLDLGRSDWSAVEVTSEGWRIVCRADVPLLRPRNLMPLPVPVRSGRARERFRALFATLSDQEFILIASWLLSVLAPPGPYAILAVDGEHGSGKTTATRMLRQLVDPNRMQDRAPPKNDGELLITGTNTHVVCIDNASKLSSDTADALCRLATGAGLDRRMLYSDGDQYAVFIRRPILLNGISALLTRGDLADRAFTASMPVIPEDQRRTEADVWAEFEAAAPMILGFLLDALAIAMARLPIIRPAKLPRMADFALLACAAAPAFGWTEDDVLTAIKANQDVAATAVLDADPLGKTLQGFAERIPANLAGKRVWEGAATQLLAELNAATPQDARAGKAWPPDATRLSNRLIRLAPALRKAGIADVQRARRADHKRARVIAITALTPKGIQE